jgi:hypothetical protein
MYKIIGADFKEYGPISADQLRQWISEGRINAYTKVQTEGSAIWRTVGELPEFASILPPPQPAPLGTPGAIAMTPSGPKTNEMARWAMITGIISLLCCQIIGPLSIVLGFVALSHLKKNPQETGSGFAITGITLGFIALVLLAIAVITAFAFPQMIPNFQNLPNSFPQ